MSLGTVRITPEDYPALYKACQISFENEGIEDTEPLFFKLHFGQAEVVTSKAVLAEVESTLSKALDNEEKYEDLIMGDLWKDDTTKERNPQTQEYPQVDADILVELFADKASWVHSALDDVADAISDAAEEALDDELE